MRPFSSMAELAFHRKTVHVRYARHMAMLWAAMSTLVFAAVTERPVLLVEGDQAPARIVRATVLTPADGPSVVLYAAVNLTEQRLDTITVMAFVFKADGTLKA